MSATFYLVRVQRTPDGNVKSTFNSFTLDNVANACGYGQKT